MSSIKGQGRPSPPEAAVWSRAHMAEGRPSCCIYLSDVFLISESRTFHFLLGYLVLYPFHFCFMYKIFCDCEKRYVKWHTFPVASLNFWGFLTSQHWAQRLCSSKQPQAESQKTFLPPSPYFSFDVWKELTQLSILEGWLQEMPFISIVLQGIWIFYVEQWW